MLLFSTSGKKRSTSGKNQAVIKFPNEKDTLLFYTL